MLVYGRRGLAGTAFSVPRTTTARVPLLQSLLQVHWQHLVKTKTASTGTNLAIRNTMGSIHSSSNSNGTGNTKPIIRYSEAVTKGTKAVASVIRATPESHSRADLPALREKEGFAAGAQSSKALPRSDQPANKTHTRPKQLQRKYRQRQQQQQQQHEGSEGEQLLRDGLLNLRLFTRFFHLL